MHEQQSTAAAEAYSTDPMILGARPRTVTHHWLGSSRPPVLVVDDDRGVRETFREMLEVAGYDVFEAANGSMGIEISRELAFGVALVDMVMPGKDGLSTIAELSCTCPDTKIIGISGHTSEPASMLSQARLYGASITLEKPIGYASLVESIRALLRIG